MNDDLTNLRDFHAGLALVGLLMKGEDGNLAIKAYLHADEMQEARVLPLAGIATLKRRTKKEKANEEP